MWGLPFQKGQPQQPCSLRLRVLHLRLNSSLAKQECPVKWDYTDKGRWLVLCSRPEETCTQSTCHSELAGMTGIVVVMRIHSHMASCNGPCNCSMHCHRPLLRKLLALFFTAKHNEDRKTMKELRTVRLLLSMALHTQPGSSPFTINQFWGNHGFPCTFANPP